MSDLVVHGLKVTQIKESGYVNWNLPSRGVVITATGPASASVLHTLAHATPRSRPAPGLLNGTEVLDAEVTVNVTGTIGASRLDSHGPAFLLHAYDGSFTTTLPPGRYQLTGQAGNAPCPSVDVSVKSGRTSSPKLVCQGE